MNVDRQRATDLLYERPYGDGARFFLPDETGRPVEVERLPPTVWRARQRVISMHFLPDPDYLSLVTLFIPVWEGADPPLLYETVLVRVDEGEVVARAATVEAARAHHRTFLTQLCERYDLPTPPEEVPGP